MTNCRDVECMSLALRLAKHGRYTTRPNPNVGCVITSKTGEVIGQGYHLRAGEAHAEINALKQAGEKAIDGTAYVTLEPCCHQGKTGPCSQALINSGVQRVVIAMRDPNPLVAGKGIHALQAQGIETTIGVMEAEANKLNRGFIKRMTQGLPWVTVKMASSLDGRTALRNGQSKWITSEHARKDVQHLRATNDAIMTSASTVLADDPSLNVRLSAEALGSPPEIIQPVRVIIDSELKTPANAKLLSLDGQSWFFTQQKMNNKFTDLKNCSVFTLNSQDNKFLLKDVMQQLAQQEINSVLVEAGPNLIGQLLQEKLVDEWINYIAPKFMGDTANGMLRINELTNMNECILLSFTDIRQVGKDLRITSSINYQ